MILATWAAFGAYHAVAGPGGTRWRSRPQSFHVSAWARANGFPAGGADVAEGGLPPLNVRWLRNAALVRARRPVAHTRATMNDQYLMRSDQVVRESRTVVAQALRGEVDKARARLAVPVFTAGFVARARLDPAAAAQETGLTPAAVEALVAGHSDTVLTGCVDHTAGPHAKAGAPCPASFLTCLSCPNARALPHQVPVQVAAADHLRAPRTTWTRGRRW
ncbi:hypothetical protein ACIBJF_33045 [Streptomyces sp. NPDC050743]|uniref:hypothetical protein n=1 Tax=Streptomyces sp. NPDC050743 TaxID=3365634 RepID=UPI00378FB8F0